MKMWKNKKIEFDSKTCGKRVFIDILQPKIKYADIFRVEWPNSLCIVNKIFVFSAQFKI